MSSVTFLGWPCLKVNSNLPEAIRIHQLLQRFVNTQQWLDSAAWSRWSSQDQRAPSHHPYSPTHLQLQQRKEPAERVPAGSAGRGSHGLNRSLCTGPTLRGLTEMSEVEMWKSQRETRRKGLNFSQPRRGKVTYLGIFSHTISVEQDFSAECDRWCFNGLTLIICHHRQNFIQLQSVFWGVFLRMCSQGVPVF